MRCRCVRCRSLRRRMRRHASAIRGCRFRHSRAVRGLERIEREQVLQVREDQFLMLLLVVQAELDEIERFHRQRAAGEQRAHALVHVRAVAQHLVETRAREHPALRPRILLADAVVIRVEEETERGIEGPVRRVAALEHEGLEEPGGVREVPLHRARVRHGLQRAILRAQALRQALARLANRGETLCQLALGERRVVGFHPSPVGLRARFLTGLYARTVHAGSLAA